MNVIVIGEIIGAIFGTNSCKKCFLLVFAVLESMFDRQPAGLDLILLFSTNR